MSLFKKSTITFTLSVQGMKCPNCARRVKEAIEKTHGASAEIDLAAAVATVTAPEKTDASAIAAAVTEIGFPAAVQE